MDMENLIILIIVIGSIYKIYQGYKEEQEKAKKRMEQIKRELQNKNPHQNPIPQTPVLQPVEPVSKPTLVTHKKEESFENFPTYDELEQKRLEINKKLQQERQKQPIKPVQLEEIDSGYFNLRKAIIQQAILDRPYKD